MALELDSGATERLGPYIERLGRHLKDCRKRESFAIYAAGIPGRGGTQERGADRGTGVRRS